MALGNLTSKAGSVLGVLITATVVTLVIASILPTVFTAIADVNAVFNDPTTTTNSTVADSLLTVFPLIIGIGFLLGVVGLIMAGVAFGRSRGFI